MAQLVDTFVPAVWAGFRRKLQSIRSLILFSQAPHCRSRCSRSNRVDRATSSVIISGHYYFRNILNNHLIIHSGYSCLVVWKQVVSLIDLKSRNRVNCTHCIAINAVPGINVLGIIGFDRRVIHGYGCRIVDREIRIFEIWPNDTESYQCCREWSREFKVSRPWDLLVHENCSPFFVRCFMGYACKYDHSAWILAVPVSAKNLKATLL